MLPIFQGQAEAFYPTFPPQSTLTCLSPASLLYLPWAFTRPWSHLNTFLNQKNYERLAKVHSSATGCFRAGPDPLL